MQIVDAHHHIWKQEDLPWLQGDMQPRIFGAYESIMRDYLVDEYIDDVSPQGVTQSVYVQANWPVENFVEETAWVSEVAAESGWPHAIVGYADFVCDDVRGQLDALAKFPLMRGVRQQFHWHQNPMYRFASGPDVLLDPRVVKNIAHLATYDWAFDLQVFTSQMKDAVALARQCPQVRFVLQHAGMLEDTTPEGLRAWREGMKRLADEPNIYCKLSGLGTFIRKNDKTHIQQITDQSIDWFGADRCLFGSNFPIEKIWTSYEDLFQAYSEALEGRSDFDQEHVLARTAQAVYRINET